MLVAQLDDRDHPLRRLVRVPERELGPRGVHHELLPHPGLHHVRPPARGPRRAC